MKRSFSFLALTALAFANASLALAGPFVPVAPANYVAPEQYILAAGNGQVYERVSTTTKASAAPRADGKFLLPGDGNICSVKKNCVPVVGRTSDSKYPVYALEGDLHDGPYTSTKANVIYQNDDLPRRMGFVQTGDVGHGIQCDFICKNGAGQVVGLNPQLKKMYGLK